MSSMTRPLNVTCIPQVLGVLCTPEEEFCGTDVFSYTIIESSGQATTATVTINVDCSDEIAEELTESNPPIANDDFYTTAQGSSVVLFVLSNDTFTLGELHHTVTFC